MLNDDKIEPLKKYYVVFLSGTNGVASRSIGCLTNITLEEAYKQRDEYQALAKYSQTRYAVRMIR